MNPLEVSGKPDFVFRSERVAIFVDGCFWHGCAACNRFPTTNIEYWDSKIARNRKRDRTVAAQLRSEGWKVLRIWEHELKALGTVVKRIRLALVA